MSHLSSKSDSTYACSHLEDTTHLSGMLEKDERELAEELIWLREASKAALQESWIEVQDLQSQCSKYDEHEALLRADLTESHSREETWRLRFLAAEKIQENSNENSLVRRQSIGSIGKNNKTSSFTMRSNMQLQQSFDKNPLVKFRDKMRLWSSGNQRRMDETRSCESMNSSHKNEAYYRATKANIQHTPSSRCMRSSPIGNLHDSSTTNITEGENFIELEEQTDGETCGRKQFYMRGNAKSQEDLSLVISSRDEIIETLEQTLNQQLNTMQTLQNEMACRVETQRLKAKNISSKQKLKEESLNKSVDSMRVILHANEIRSKEQDKNLRECKEYIHELSGELEKLLKIVTRAQEKGFLEKCN